MTMPPLAGTSLGFTGFGNEYIAADGNTLASQSQATQQAWLAQYGGNNQIAQQAWANAQNQTLLELGLAINTSNGVQYLPNVIAQLQQHGYTGPLDANSVAQAYQMLTTPPPAATPSGTAATTSIASGLNLGGIPQPLLIGGGALLVFMLLFRGRG